jgi:hypothetical protein
MVGTKFPAKDLRRIDVAMQGQPGMAAPDVEDCPDPMRETTGPNPQADNRTAFLPPR